MYCFSVDHNSIDKYDILNIHKYLITNNDIKKMISLIKKVFLVLLNFRKYVGCIARVSARTKSVSLNNKPCIDRPTLFGLDPVELKYYPLMISLAKCSRNVISY